VPGCSKPEPPRSSSSDAGSATDATVHSCKACTIVTQTVSVARSDRTRTKIGVGERVTLTASGSGPFNWVVGSGGKISASSGDTVVFTAGDRAGTVLVTATGSGCSCSVSFTVVEPSGAYQEKFGATVHTRGSASAGFRGITYLTPKDVSFENVEIIEGTCEGVGTGSQAKYDKQVHPAWTSGWATVGGGTDAKGSVVQGPNQTGSTYWDFVFENEGAAPPGPGAGTFKWVIPWKFRVSGGAEKVFTHLTHYTVYEAGGKVTISKGGVTASAVPSDATENP
jgi:hypothetical protein